jgi:hypothetical protein
VQRLQLAFAFGALVVASLVVSRAAPEGQDVQRVAAPTREPATMTAAPTIAPSRTPAATAAPSIAPAAPTPAAAVAPPRRDVYYVVIERYPSREILANEFGFDNTEYLDALRARGFVIPSGVRGPYPKTPHSISSTVNMDYLSFPRTSRDWGLVNSSLRNSKVAQLFKSRGYQYVLIGSGYYALRRDETADVNLVCRYC